MQILPRCVILNLPNGYLVNFSINIFMHLQYPTIMTCPVHFTFVDVIVILKERERERSF
jgi:hypothetical protein